VDKVPKYLQLKDKHASCLGNLVHSALALGEGAVDNPLPSTAQRNEFYEAYLVVAENDPY
jgi:hypothetical protein